MWIISCAINQFDNQANRLSCPPWSPKHGHSLCFTFYLTELRQSLIRKKKIFLKISSLNGCPLQPCTFLSNILSSSTTIHVFFLKKNLFTALPVSLLNLYPTQIIPIWMEKLYPSFKLLQLIFAFQVSWTGYLWPHVAFLSVTFHITYCSLLLVMPIHMPILFLWA